MKLAMSAEIKTQFNGATANLLCPRCNTGHLHHVSVSMMDREEDAADVTLIEIVRK